MLPQFGCLIGRLASDPEYVIEGDRIPYQGKAFV